MEKGLGCYEKDGFVFAAGKDDLKAWIIDSCDIESVDEALLDYISLFHEKPVGEDEPLHDSERSSYVYTLNYFSGTRAAGKPRYLKYKASLIRVLVVLSTIFVLFSDEVNQAMEQIAADLRVQATINIGSGFGTSLFVKRIASWCPVVPNDAYCVLLYVLNAYKHSPFSRMAIEKAYSTKVCKHLSPKWDCYRRDGDRCEFSSTDTPGKFVQNAFDSLSDNEIIYRENNLYRLRSGKLLDRK
ncbi:MAG: hypothetical protein LBG82_09260 [Clostridiales Family XIII bacterium]|jgi:hypothetical protein|nr:hypothetical protein [Clostridiales Family XIII bacterium]